MKFQAIVLTDAGDFLSEEETSLNLGDKGVEIQSPWIFTEEELAHRVKAEKVFIPYTSIQNIQYGDFEQETV